MSKFIPDTPREYAYIGAAVGRLGATMTGFGIMEGNAWWGFTALFFTWIGFEVNGYFKIHEPNDPKQ